MKKLLVMLADGFEEIEALTVVDILRRANVKCSMCTLEEKEVRGTHDIKVIADISIDNESVKDYDGVILPGGLPGATNLRDSEKVLNLIRDYNKKDKLIAAICAAPIVLSEAGLTEGKAITSYPGFEEQLGNCLYKEDLVVRDGNIITSRGPATAMLFAYEILNYFGYKKEAENLYEGMLVKDLIK